MAFTAASILLLAVGLHAVSSNSADPGCGTVTTAAGTTTIPNLSGLGNQIEGFGPGAITSYTVRPGCALELITPGNIMAELRTAGVNLTVAQRSTEYASCFCSNPVCGTITTAAGKITTARNRKAIFPIKGSGPGAIKSYTLRVGCKLTLRLWNINMPAQTLAELTTEGVILTDAQRSSNQNICMCRD